MAGLTIIALRPCEYCKGEGKVHQYDIAKKRVMVRPCPVCNGFEGGALTVQGDVIGLMKGEGRK